MYNMLIYLNMCLNTSAIHVYVVYYTLWFIVSSIYDLFNRFSLHCYIMTTQWFSCNDITSGSTYLYYFKKIQSLRNT